MLSLLSDGRLYRLKEIPYVDRMSQILLFQAKIVRSSLFSLRVMLQGWFSYSGRSDSLYGFDYLSGLYDRSRCSVEITHRTRVSWNPIISSDSSKKVCHFSFSFDCEKAFWSRVGATKWRSIWRVPFCYLCMSVGSDAKGKCMNVSLLICSKWIQWWMVDSQTRTEGSSPFLSFFLQDIVAWYPALPDPSITLVSLTMNRQR